FRSVGGHLGTHEEGAAGSKIKVAWHVCGNRWFEVAVKPVNRYRRHGTPGRKLVNDVRGLGRAPLVEGGRTGLNRLRVAKIECPEGRVHDVTGHVTECTASIFPPAAPLKGQVGRIVGLFL